MGDNERPWWRRLADLVIPRIGLAFARFPISMAFAVALTLFYFFDLDEAVGLSLDHEWRPLMILVSGFAMAFAAELGAGPEGRSGLALRMAAIGALTLLVGLAVWNDVRIALEPLMLLSALWLAIGVWPSLVRPVDNDGFWAFNHNLWVGFAMAGLGAILFGAGLSAIIWTLDYLFGLKFPDEAHEKIWILALCFVAPLNWLTLAPKPGEVELEEDRREFTSRAVTVLVAYILVPLLIAYTAILYAYGATIAAQWALPQGRIGWMVLLFGSVGMLSALLAYPDRQTGNAIVRWFWRNWFWLVLGPTLLMCVSIYERVAAYGWTIERYLVAAAALWFVAIAGVYALGASRRDLRLMPGLLAVLLLVSSAGPFGARGLSVASQVEELSDLAEKHGLIEGGHLVKNTDKAIPEADRERFSSIVYYLARDDLDALAPLFRADDPASPFAETVGSGDRAGAVLAYLGGPTALAFRPLLGFNHANPVFSLPGGLRVLANLYVASTDHKGGQASYVLNGAALEVRLAGDVLTIVMTDGEQHTFDLTRVAVELGFAPGSTERKAPGNDTGEAKPPAKEASIAPGGPVFMPVSLVWDDSGQQRAGILPQMLNGNWRDDGRLAGTYLSFLLVLRDSEGR